MEITMEMTIDTIIKDCEQSIKQSELFIKAHQKNMEIGEIKEYQYYIERDKLIINTMRKYKRIEEIISKYGNVGTSFMCIDKIREVIEDDKRTY